MPKLTKEARAEARQTTVRRVAYQMCLFANGSCACAFHNGGPCAAAELQAGVVVSLVESENA